MKKGKYIVYVLVTFCIIACNPKRDSEKNETASLPASVETIPAVVKHIAEALPLDNSNASVFFQKLDSVVIKEDDIATKQKVECKRYSIYYTTDSAQIVSIWMDLNEGYELTIDQLNDVFKTDWKPEPSNDIDIKTEDAVMHKKYNYSTPKGIVNITVYSKYDKITGLLVEFKNKS